MVSIKEVAHVVVPRVGFLIYVSMSLRMLSVRHQELLQNPSRHRSVRFENSWVKESLRQRGGTGFEGKGASEQWGGTTGVGTRDPGPGTISVHRHPGHRFPSEPCLNPSTNNSPWAPLPLPEVPGEVGEVPHRIPTGHGGRTDKEG